MYNTRRLSPFTRYLILTNAFRCLEVLVVLRAAGVIVPEGATVVVDRAHHDPRPRPPLHHSETHPVVGSRHVNTSVVNFDERCEQVGAHFRLAAGQEVLRWHHFQRELMDAPLVLSGETALNVRVHFLDELGRNDGRHVDRRGIVESAYNAEVIRLNDERSVSVRVTFWERKPFFSVTQK